MSTATAHEEHTHTHADSGCCSVENKAKVVNNADSGCCSVGSKAPAIEQPVAPPCPISLTERAATEVKRAMADYQTSGENPEGGELYLRVRTIGAGCSGMEDKLDLDPNYNQKLDNLYELQGVKVLVDKRSMLYLEGAVIDYLEDLNRRGFNIQNPHAKKRCGCGSSYTV